MAEGLSTAAANSLLDSLGTTYTWVQLHTAAPGAAGTTSVATETTRKQVTWASASGGSKASSAALTWTSIAGSQDATHFTVWSASTAGTFGFSGVITANAYTAGDTFTIPSGSLTASLVVAS